MVVFPRDTLQLDPPPRGTLRAVDFLHQPLGAPAQRNELNPKPVEFMEIGVGRQLRVEDQLLGYCPVRSFQNRTKRRISSFSSALRNSPLA